MRRIVHILSLATAAALAVGVAILAVPLARYTPDMPVPPTSGTTAVVLRETDLPTHGTLQLTWSAARSVKSTTLSGSVVTGVFATKGQAVAYGARLLEVDGQPVVALCGERPLWRAVTGGTVGPDVDQVVKLLRDAGKLSTTNPSGLRLTAAIKSWQVSMGMAPTGSITPGNVVWVGQSLTPSVVSVHVGDVVSEGLAIFEVQPQLTRAQLTGGPGRDGAPARVVNLPGIPDVLPLAASGEVDQLDALERLIRANNRSDGPLPTSVDAVSRLQTAITVAAVPATAVVSAANGTCVLVVDDAGTHPVMVAVVNSEIEGVLVTGSLDAGEQVVTSPRSSKTC